jgi:ABC-type transport system involved in multi-copper enzyme maturation permease subunit
MRFRKIFSLEFAYLVRSTSTRLYAAVLLLFTLVMNGLTTPGDGVYENNSFHITAITVIGCLIWLVLGASIAGQAAARDVQTGMHPLSYTTPISKLDYLGGRFLAAFLVNALLVLLLPLGTLLSFYLPGLDGEELLPFRPWAYGNVYFFVALPNAFIATTLQFTFAALSRRVMSSYLASLLLAIFAQIIAITAARLFGNWDLVKLLDPVGVSGIVGNELQTWTVTEKNTRLITLEGMFLWNRVLWLGAAAGWLWLAHRRFRFAHTETTNWWSRFKRRQKMGSILPTETAALASAAIKVPQVQSSFALTTSFRQVLRIAGESFKQLARSPVGLTLVAVIALASVLFAKRIMTQFEIPLIPTTQLVIDYLTAPVGDISTAWVVIPLLIMYFAGELVWRERDAGLSDIMDATPATEWTWLTGKFLGLCFLIVAWMAILMACGIGMQLVLGYDQLNIGLYLQALFGLQLVDYLLFALLALVVHVVVHQKFTGYLVVFLVFLFISFSSTLGVEHPMLVFGKDPGWWYTDMRGFGATLGPWLWFKLYWTGWALLLAVAARLLWARGREQHFKFRLQSAHRRFSSKTARVALMGTGLLFTMGSFIFYNTHVLNKYQTSSDINSRKAAYERRYSKYINAPQPQLVATKLHVEIYPGRQQVEIRAAYTLLNKDSVTIDSIHVGSVSGIAPVEVAFNRAAKSVLADKELGHYIYKLEQPLLPGDSLRMDFVVRHQHQGFSHNSINALIVKNGSYFTNYDLLPAIGYLRYRELKDAVLRKKHKLAPRSALPSLYDAAARKKPASTDQSSFEAIIGTQVGEVAVAPGKLYKNWTSGGRRYFHYKTDAPIGGEYAIFSANYAMQESTWNDVAIRVYYHPDHALNIERILRSVKASLAYYTEHFGLYPFKHFTVVERAGFGGGASADASMVNYGEQYALMNPDDSPDGFDLPFYIMAHEMAHQWWGMAPLTPANVEGAGVLIEGLAVYSGMQVLEKAYGAAHLQQYVAYLHASYAIPRSLATPSLLQANEEFLYYRKGGLAMHALSKYIGKKQVNGALRSLLQKHNSGELPFPTTLDLYGELEQVTPDSLQYLLHDLFKENTYWRLKTKSLAVAQTAAGAWEATLQVQAQKVVMDATGAEKEMPMNDLLEVGLYEEGNGQNKPLYLQLHRIRSGEQTIKVTVPRKPDRGGIDPNFLMIDLRLDDNVAQVGGE